MVTPALNTRIGTLWCSGRGVSLSRIGVAEHLHLAYNQELVPWTYAVG